MDALSSVECVTFDFWETLVHEPDQGLSRSRVAAWRRILEVAGHAVTEAALRDAFAVTWSAHDRAWRGADRPFGGRAAARHALELLSVRVPPDTRAELVDVFTGIGSDVRLELAPDISETCLRLRQSGIRLGIVSDAGFVTGRAMRGFLERWGLLRLFDGWAFSDEVGVHKPSPQIFHTALSAAGGTPAARAVHVGDVKRTDVAGARAVGMRALRYRGFADDPGPGPEADAVIDAHAHILELLH
jgi:putative hydrolase of the HAD superfamily